MTRPNDFHKINAKILSEAFTMFEHEYVHEWQQICKSCRIAWWKHTTLVMMAAMAVVVVHFIEDFIRMIYLTHALTYSLPLWQRYVCRCTVCILIPRHVDAVNPIQNRQILVGCKAKCRSSPLNRRCNSSFVNCVFYSLSDEWAIGNVKRETKWKKHGNHLINIDS